MTEAGFPSSSIAIVDPKTGLSTNAFWRVLELIWRRSGGADDIAELLQQEGINVRALAQTGVDDAFTAQETAETAQDKAEEVEQRAVNPLYELDYVDQEIRKDLSREILMRAGATGGEVAAADVSYSNSSSNLTAVDVQAAIDEVDGRVDTAEGLGNAISGFVVENSGSTLELVEGGDGDAIFIDAEI